MSIDFDSGAGVFDVLGALFAWSLNLNGFAGSSAPSPSSVWGSGGHAIRDSNTQFTTFLGKVPTANKYLVDGIYAQQKSIRASLQSAVVSTQAIATNYLIAVVNKDTPLSAQTIAAAMPVFISQMKSQSKTIKQNTVSATVTAGGSNTGTATMICGLKGANGLNQEYVFPENITFTCTADQNSGAVAGAEVLTYSAPSVDSSKFDFNWPTTGYGSGVAGSINVVDPTKTGVNLLTNSSFELFTSNIPNGWSVLVGTAGSTFQASSSTTLVARSTNSLQIIGNGSELTALAQQLTLKAATVYALNAYVRVSTTPVAGVLAIELVDGSNNVINDDNSVANTISQSLTSVSTSWIAVNGFIRTPTNIPSTTKLRVRLSTALDNAKSVYIDDLAMCVPTQLYVGGPYIAAFRGATDLLKNDTWTVAVSNTMGNVWTTQSAGQFQSLFNIYFNMREGGFQLPSASSPTTADSLIA